MATHTTLDNKDPFLFDHEDLEQIKQMTGRKFYDFVLSNERLLRDLAGKRREFEWVHKLIDWIKGQDKPEGE